MDKNMKNTQKYHKKIWFIVGVPSAIEHAGGVPVYVESNYSYLMDLEDCPLVNPGPPSNFVLGRVQKVYVSKPRCSCHVPEPPTPTPKLKPKPTQTSCTPLQRG
eukprot:6484324-Amphidinium_carterae.1